MDSAPSCVSSGSARAPRGPSVGRRLLYLGGRALKPPHTQKMGTFDAVIHAFVAYGYEIDLEVSRPGSAHPI
jgi:hypothetical protein